jgi:hypothetical protein
LSPSSPPEASPSCLPFCAFETRLLVLVEAVKAHKRAEVEAHGLPDEHDRALYQTLREVTNA